MKKLNEVLLSEIDEFRSLGHKFLKGEVSKMDFKKASGGMGVYAHRNGKEFMIRFRIPSGIASRENLKLIYDFANRYNLKGIHLTTRQAVQLHGISIDDICDAMKEGIEKGLYSRGSGGNFPRNVAVSPLSGVEKEEAFDVSPYALAVGQHFLKKIYLYKLPRKLKVSFSNNNDDLSHVTVVDLGFLAVKKNEKDYFKVYLGGGLGRNPKLSAEFPELIESKDVLYHIEAMTELFINEGDYNNSGKARIRYIMERMGKEEFVNCYKSYLEKVKANENLEIDIKEKFYPMTSRCNIPPYKGGDNSHTSLDNPSKLGGSTNSNQVRFIDNRKEIETAIENPRLVSQKQFGLYSIYIHPVGGQLSLKDLKLILEETENIEDVEIRLSLTEGLYIRNLNGKEAEILLEKTKHIGGVTRLEHSVSCIGVPICQMGVLETQRTLKEIVDYFKRNNFTKDVLPQIHISGCPNSCGVHEIGKIGLCGKMKKINGELRNVFELHLEGDLGVGKTKLAKYYGDILQEKIPEFLYELAIIVDDSNEEFSKCIERNEEQINKFIQKYIV
ncbi:nitrite/sulfite reductase [Clostridium pasteurianum]|uniref:Sulfite reductase, beta subunit (Hemoprotein) n=1 Tax=Clostridium pasteurianum BC1 TaxID=86416 RepID=R4KHA1_CLOPA|nr:nitrite/sulfite reductase [Clostridium pasteurianum]AGK98990.1 sulfite reductase, beta subunit (hemoprotein) [Clostridium pasteurianum BC1]